MLKSFVDIQQTTDGQIGVQSVSFDFFPPIRPLLLTDAAGRIQHVAPTLAQRMGRPVEDVLGRSISDFVEQAEQALLRWILDSFHGCGGAQEGAEGGAQRSAPQSWPQVEVQVGESTRVAVRPLYDEGGELLGLEWGQLLSEGGGQGGSVRAKLDDLLAQQRAATAQVQWAKAAPAAPEEPPVDPQQILASLGHDLLLAKSMMDVLQGAFRYISRAFPGARLLLQARLSVDASLVRIRQQADGAPFPEKLAALAIVQEKMQEVTHTGAPAELDLSTATEGKSWSGRLLLAPIGQEGEVFGVALLWRPDPQSFRLNEVEFLARLLHLCGVAIANLRLRWESEEQMQEMSHYTASLLQSNAEIQRFSYVVDHDLKESVRMVSSYLQLLQQRYARRLDEDGQTFLAFAMEGAQRLDELIDDLRAYTQAESSVRRFTLVDANAALERAVLFLRQTILETDARVQVTPLPVVRSNDYLLTQLFVELLENALKFRGEDRPQIRIWAEEQDDGWLFGVADRGIGIAPAYHEAIFEMFRRLHPRSQYPGGGMGLAIAKKIVEWHGGRIWVESQLGQGATFYFLLPKG